MENEDKHTGFFSKDGKPIEFVNLPDPDERELQKQSAAGLYMVYRDFLEAGFEKDEAMTLMIAMIHKANKGGCDEQQGTKHGAGDRPVQHPAAGYPDLREVCERCREEKL